MQTTPTTPPDAPGFAALLKSAVHEPGKLAACYAAFHNYSFGNQLLAFWQCAERGIPIGPIATFQGWKTKGRFVLKGSKALTLCMPVTGKRTDRDTSTGEETTAVFTRFVYRRNWFVMSQTDGQDFTPEPIGDFDISRALTVLDITRVNFEHLDGNCQGYALDRKIAINPVAAMPMKTTLHEMAHILHGHTAESMLSDDDRTPKNIREVEAEAVALLVSAALGLPGLEYSRGYIQHWYGSGQDIPERSAQKILKVTDQILRAGRPATVRHDDQE